MVESLPWEGASFITASFLGVSESQSFRINNENTMISQIVPEVKQYSLQKEDIADEKMLLS
jgi:hypothetical protein